MLSYFIIKLADLYALILIVYILMSWFPIRQGTVVGDIENFLARISEPFLGIFRKLLPPIGGMVDVTPIIALLVLQFGARLIASLFAFV